VLAYACEEVEVLAWRIALVEGELVVIPHSKKEGTKPPYMWPGYSNHTHGNNMINKCNIINKRVIFLTQ
jgi:hypothetical protein